MKQCGLAPIYLDDMRSWDQHDKESRIEPLFVNFHFYLFEYISGW